MSSKRVTDAFIVILELLLICSFTMKKSTVYANLLAKSWSYDAGSFVRSEGHSGMVSDGNNSTCYITKVYSNPWLTIDIGNKDGSTHGKLFVVNRVQTVKCQGQKCADNFPDIYVSTSTDVTKLTDAEKCGSYDSRVSLTVTCSPPLMGSNIFIRVTGNSSLGICEVLANGYVYQECTNRRYGTGCGIPCNCQSQCHSVTGVCTGSCDAGWTKDSTGICSIQGCTNDRYGPGCNTLCNCKSQCDSLSGVCSASCVAGKMKNNAGVCSVTCNNNNYGEDCRKPCNCQSQCDAVSGVCSASCDAGKMKDNAGVCSVTCNNNNYGEDCHKPCNCQSQCDPVSGVCSASCDAGKMKDNAGVCSVTCNNGGYGVDCNTPCHCTTQCGHESGLCMDSCDSGWLKSTNGVCNIKNCTNGNYGPGCVQSCNCQSQCDVISGVCLTSCSTGKMKDGNRLCSIACNNRHYGVDCRTPCNCESQCDAVSGVCSASCVPGKMKDKAGVCNANVQVVLNIQAINITSQGATIRWIVAHEYSMKTSFKFEYRKNETIKWTTMSYHLYSPFDKYEVYLDRLTYNTWYLVRVTPYMTNTRNSTQALKHAIISFKTLFEDIDNDLHQDEAPSGGMAALIAVVVLLLVVICVISFISIRRKKPDNRSAFAGAIYENVDRETGVVRTQLSETVTSHVYQTLQKNNQNLPNGESEYSTLMITNSPVATFESYYKNITTTVDKFGASDLQKQFQRLLAVISSRKFFVSKAALSNKKRNQTRQILPGEEGRVILTQRGKNDYINAVYAGPCIVTQAPLQGTVADFWTMVFEQNCQTIVMLCSKTNGKGKYWPDENTSCLAVGHLEVKAVATRYHNNDIFIRELQLRKNGATDSGHLVYHVHYLPWSDSDRISRNAQSFARLFNTVDDCQFTGRDKPIVVHDRNGGSRCGIFSVICAARARMNTDNQIDVFNTTLEICKNRPQLIQYLEEYQFIHEVLSKLIELGANQSSDYEEMKL